MDKLYWVTCQWYLVPQINAEAELGLSLAIFDTVIIQQVLSSQYVCFLLNLDSLAGDLLRHTLGPTTFTGGGIVPRYQIQETRKYTYKRKEKDIRVIT